MDVEEPTSKMGTTGGEEQNRAFGRKMKHKIGEEVHLGFRNKRVFGFQKWVSGNLQFFSQLGIPARSHQFHEYAQQSHTISPDWDC